MLEEIIKEDYIQFNVEVQNFVDAIRVAAKPLLRDKAITQEYIDEIIQIYRTIGPYIVITKHIALPHAPSSNGALRVALGFTRLRKPVVSGNQSNDPVQLLFTLSAPDSESHLDLLSHLVQVLSNEEAISELQTTEDPTQVIKILRK